jgi:hypothetical protein
MGVDAEKQIDQNGLADVRSLLEETVLESQISM